MIGRLILVITIPFIFAGIGAVICGYFAWCCEQADKRAKR